MVRRRYTITLAVRRFGVERCATFSGRSVLLTLGTIVMLPVLIGFGAAWKASSEVRELSARNRALEIETANHRAASQALAKQTESLRLALSESDGGSASAGPSTRGEPSSRAIMGSAPSPRASRAPSLTSARESEATAPLAPIRATVTDGPGNTGHPVVRSEQQAFTETLAQAEPEARAESRQRAEAPASPAPNGNSGENTIDGVIAQYVSGLETRNLAAIKRVWPSLDPKQERAIETEFQNARSVEASFADPRITISGDTTTATGIRKYSLVTQDGQRLSRATTTTLTLRRRGAGWVIERVVHEQ